MTAKTPRAWDLSEPGDIRLFAQLDGAPASREPFPLPSRALRFPAPAPPAPDLAPALPPGVVWIAGKDEWLIAGPSHRLREAAHRWRCPAGSELVELLDRYEAPPPPLRLADGRLLGKDPRHTLVMGVLNVTPDSFSDGGRHLDPAAALEAASRMIGEGADILDVGGESTRPGSKAPSTEEELARVVPVIARIAELHPELPVSVDTRRAAVAAAALDAGAAIVNDVSALGDPAMAPLLAERGCPVVLMHMRGTPETMQDETRYADAAGEILDHLAEVAARARSAGVASDRLCVDPGIGFGKSATTNEELLRLGAVFRSLGYPVLVGASRKSFIGRRTGVEVAAERLAGSLAAAVIAAREGARIVRVHDVAETRQALALADAVAGMDEPGRG